VTCICGVADGTLVVIGGDSASSNEGHIDIDAGPKVFQKGELLIGGSGVGRVGQLVQYVFQPPASVPGQEVMEYMVKDFTRSLGRFLKHEDEDLLGGDKDDYCQWYLLLGLRGRLFNLCSHLDVGECAVGYDAIGSGANYALGSLATTEGQGPRARVEAALRAAERHDNGVAGPFEILESRQS
jgi:hypothetical protein